MGMVIVCRMTLARRSSSLPAGRALAAVRMRFFGGGYSIGGVTALRQTQERHASRVRKGQLLLKHIVETLPYFYITDCGHGHSHLASDSAALLAIGTSRGHTAHATCTCCDDAAPMGADTRTRTTGERHVCKSCERRRRCPAPRGALFQETGPSVAWRGCSQGPTLVHKYYYGICQ